MATESTHSPPARASSAAGGWHCHETESAIESILRIARGTLDASDIREPLIHYSLTGRFLYSPLSYLPGVRVGRGGEDEPPASARRATPAGPLPGPLARREWEGLKAASAPEPVEGQGRARAQKSR